MIKLSDLDESLSLKLGDPVSDNGDGKIFDWSDRVNYINRAYARLLRILPKLMGKETPEFANIKQLVEQDVEAGTQRTGVGIVIKSNNEEIIVQDVEEVFINVIGENSPPGAPATSATTSTANFYYSGSATFIDPDKYLSVKNGKNELYKPSFADKKFFYTFLQGKIYMLPTLASGGYSKISLVFKKDADAFVNGEDIVRITNEYIDILITMAANEGMQDLARQDKVNLYTGDLNNQLGVLKAYSDMILSKEGSNVNG